MSSIVQPLEITHHQQQPLQQQQNINVSNNQDLSNTSINPSNLSRILSSSSQKTSSFSQEQNKTDTATSVTVSSGGNNISTANNNNNNNKINNINSTCITNTGTNTPLLKGKQDNHLSSNNNTNNIKNTNIDKKLTNNKKVTLNLNNSNNNTNNKTNNNTKTTNNTNTSITTAKRLNKKLSLQSFRSSINHNSNSNKNNKNNTDNTSPVKNNTNTKSSSLKEFSNKISINISSFFNKLKYITDQCLDSDEITDELFDSDSVFDSQENLIKNNINSNSVSNINTITVKSIDNKNQLNNHIMEFNTTTTANISTSTTLNTNSNTNTNSNSILKSDGENLNNFSNGEELWKLQNEEWLTPSSENDTRQGKLLLQKKVHDQEIKHCISSKDYHIVYKNLVINNKKLKKPMNLKDLVKVIEAGWNWTKVFENSSANRF